MLFYKNKDIGTSKKEIIETINNNNNNIRNHRKTLTPIRRGWTFDPVDTALWRKSGSTVSSRRHRSSRVRRYRSARTALCRLSDTRSGRRRIRPRPTRCLRSGTDDGGLPSRRCNKTRLAANIRPTRCTDVLRIWPSSVSVVRGRRSTIPSPTTGLVYTDFYQDIWIGQTIVENKF